MVYGLNFHFSQEEIENALKATDRVISKYDNYKRGLDSASTVFMKQLGYEGVDVRGIKGLDNTAYGSVIYDLKGEDLARKKEIGTAKYSISPSLDSDLQDVLKNTFPKSKGEVLIGNTSDFMVNVMEAEPHLVTMPATKAYRAMVTEDEAKAAGRYKESRSEFDNYHGLGRGGLISALEAAEKPVIAFAAAPDYETGDRRYGYIVLVTDQTDSEGNYIVVVQRVDSKGRINKRRVDVNKIITVYGKDYIKGQVQDAIADNRMLFVDKKRSHVIDGGISVRFADGHQSDFKNNINDFWANVNYEKSKGSYSLSYSQDEMDAHRAELENDAEANYGEKYTDDFNESGYVFPNGKMLKMGMYGTRGEDHAMASLAYDDIGYDTYFSPKAEAQKRFINEGNIRYMPENGWLNLGTEIEPTAEQYAWIRRAINNSSEGITRIEFTNMEDSTVDHKDYDRWASASDIINDIKRFYSTGKIGGSELSQFRYSLTASFEAVGCDIRMENGLIKAFNADGTEIKEFKPSDIRKSPLGRLLTLASTETRNRSKILSANDVNNQITFLTKLYNMILNTQDPDLIWAVSGTIGYDPKHALGNTSWLKEAKSKFASITGNADPQYKTTIDFTTICVKTQAVIDAMSKVMMDLGRGLTEHEIIDIVYKETAIAGEQVPCPVCYVFSRWVGLGNLFGKIKQFQQDYPEDMDMTAVRKEYESIKKEVDKLVKEQTGKKSGSKARNKLYAETIERKDLLDLKKQMPNKGLTAAEEKELEDLNRRLDILDHWSWLEKTRLADDYKAVPDDVLFDLNAGRAFATDYPATWRFRTTRGPALGKAVAPYSPSRLGDTIKGIASPSTLAKLGNSKRVFLNQKGLTTTAKKTYEKAIANAKRQNRMNGQRLQSTSDFRFEYGLDYLLSFIELEAIGAKAQMYTKVPEAVKFLASTGTEVNCSIMAKGTGLDENGELIFSDITGMSWEDARMLSSMYNNVQPILVAIGREHLIKAMANKFITMIIPYHASGSSEDRYRSMMEAVGEAVEERTDFAEFENEHERADATPEQKLCRKLRVDILTGKFENGSLDAKEKAALKNNEILRQLYIRIYGKDENGNRAKPNRKYVENFDKDGNDSDCLEVYLTKEQAGVMMPYEYWDKQSNIKDADKQGEAYVKYCESLGITPVFSGWDSKGKYDANMDFTSYPGYWKTLIDRCMYNNDGTYHKQKAVSVNNVDLDMLDSNKMKKGIFKPMQTQNTEMTEQIAERSKEKIREEASQSKLSLSESSEAAPTTKEYKSTVKKLEEQVSDLKAEFKRTNLKTADPKQVRIQAGRFLKRHDANNSLHSEVVDTFNKIFGLYKEKGTDAFDEVYEIAQKTAVDVVNSISVIHDEGAEDYKAIKDYLKNTEIKVSDEMKRNITDYNDFRKHNFGRLKLVNGETSNIDNVYMELMEMFPGQFTEDYVNPADQLYHIVDVLDNYAPYYESLDGASEEMQDYVTMVAADLMDTAYGLQTKKTFADRMHSKIEKYQEELWLANERTAAEKMRGEMDVQRAKSEASDSKKKLKEQKQRYEEARKKAIASRKKALDRQKQRYEDKLAAIRESKKKRSERKAESELRSKLLRVAQRLDRLKTTEDNRKQIESLIGELDLVAKSMTMSTVKDIYALRDWYEAMRENDPYFHDSNIEAKLSRLGKKRIADMDINDVRELTDVLLNFEASIRNQNKLIQSEYKKGIKEAGLEVIKDVNESKGVKDNVLGTVDKFFINGTLSPERQIHRITGYNDKDPLYIATKELSKGQREMLTYQMNSWNMFKKFMEDKKFVDSLNGKKAREVSIPCTINGENTEIKVTPDLAISIYLSSLNEDNMRHMGKGGVDIPDIKAYKNGKIKEAFRNSTRVKFTKGQLSKLRHSLTAQEKAFADMAYKYYNEVAPDAINEVSETLKGYSLAKVENYFPIQVNKNFLERDFESLKFDGTIEGMGSLKERVKDQKPIVINGIVDTLTRSIKENSMYVGLAIPVRNFSKLLGVKDVQYSDTQNGNMIDTEVTYNGSVQESIVNKWGDQGMNYIEKFMSDLQTSKASGDDWENVLNKWRSNYAGAVLTLNASVAIKQAASYPTAMAVLGGRPLARAMADVGKVDLDLIEKYTPLQWYRSQGYSTKELGDIRSGRKGSAIDKVTSIPALNWIQGMDLLTTRKLWKASEYYIQEHNKSLKVGTDEYYKAVAEIYNRVIEETQPNYTVMQRPGLLRSDKSMVQMLNMFKTQPYQNFNILYDAIGNYAAKRSRYKADKSSVSQAELKKAFKDLQNATASQVLQLAVFAAMTSLWAIFRGKDKDYEDEEGNLTIESYMKKLAKDMLSGSAAMVPLGADIYNSVSSAITGDYYYGFSSVTDSSISDLFNSLNQTMTLIPSVANYAKDRMPGEPIPDELKKSTLKLAENASRFSGIPYSNVKNLFDGTYRWAAIAGYGEYVGEYLAQKNSMAKDSAMKETLFRAYQNDMDQYNKLRKMMIEDGFKEDSLDSYMKGKKKENKTDSQQTAYDKSMQKLEGSPLWKEASADEQKRYSNIMEKLAVGIDDNDTASYTKKMASGLSAEQIVLYKLALKKVDKPNANGNMGTYTKDEKEAALRLLGASLNSKQKETLMG